MILHQIFTNPSTESHLQQCLDICGDEDGILLMQEGVYGHLHSLIKHAIARGLSVYVSQKDLAARGLTLQTTNITVVNDGQWLALCLQYHKVVTWS
ncbi:MAG: sulfurtransferase complex subunit TusB [Paraglaciecola sp.]|uniref:sulfurtransferase complex subunit TusB n=1 Tax=Paraglaciecola sp. TaxID=1920173 RepID=UPI00273FFC0F|nr:sulfurtransferase complex subunit TusB [Paraglaciecola sp.]MDP5031061.1 sulfurtransferase complex subunit TusB [Paraglaciecola sp.]MDP5131364.1 sulfurtransferase complex subunit TusB [Paraglaciecola sp.]